MSDIYGSKMNSKSNNGVTALILEAGRGHKDTVEYLRLLQVGTTIESLFLDNFVYES